jgi:hypothetical protein
MPITTTGPSTLEYANGRAGHMTKSNNPEDSVTIAFPVTDDAGREEIIRAR